MRLMYRFIAYIVILHIAFTIPSYYIFRENKLLLLAVEGFYVVSLYIGIVLIRQMFKPLDLIATGSELIDEADFVSTFRTTGLSEIDRLIELFNAMIVRLRNERLTTEEQHYFLQKLIASIPTGIIILDYNGRIDSMNASMERLLSLPTRTALGKSPEELPLPFMTLIRDLMNNESVVVSFRGNRRLKCFKSQFIDRGFPRIFILIEEVTEEIRQSEKTAYEKLIRMLSHEINNSVAAVGSLLQSCRNYTPQIAEVDRDDYSNALEVSITRLQNLNEFTKQYADIVRLPQPNLAPHDITTIMIRCQELFKEESDANNIDWNFSIDDDIPSVRCDRVQMEQVFINVYKNAVEAIGSDGVVMVNASAREGIVSLAVGDTGCGIDDEVRKNLFRPFYSTKPNGQGIGLTLVREILERHGFQYFLEGGEDGITRFTIEVIQNHINK